MANLTVTGIGRWKNSGNSQTHTLAIIKLSDNSIVAQTTANMASGVADTFVYGALTSPVTLLAGEEYALMSSEASGGDNWSDDTPSNNIVSDASKITILGSRYGASDFSSSAQGVAGNRAYVGLDLQCAPSPTVLTPTASAITSFTPQALRNNFSGSVGFGFAVNPQVKQFVTGRGAYNNYVNDSASPRGAQFQAPTAGGITIKNLSFYVYGRNNATYPAAETHTIKLVRDDTKEILATVTFNINDLNVIPQSAIYTFVKFPVTPAHIPAGVKFNILHSAPAGGALILDHDTIAVIDSSDNVTMIGSAAAATNFTDAVTIIDAGNFSYGPMGFGYIPDPIDVAPTNLQTKVISARRVKLTFDYAGNQAQTFRIERKVGNGAYSEINYIGSSLRIFNDDLPPEGQTVTYRVRAQKSDLSYTSYSTESVAVVPTLAVTISVPATAYVGEPIKVICTATGQQTERFPDGRQPYLATRVVYGNGHQTNLLESATGATIEGPLNMVAYALDTSNREVSATATVTILPRPAVTATYDVPGEGSVSANNAAMQNAVDNAIDWSEIILEAGVDYGQLILKNSTRTGYVIIKSSNFEQLPNRNIRVSPSNSVNMPKIMTATNVVEAILTELYAHHFIFEGVEIGMNNPNYLGSALINLGTTLSTQNTSAKAAHHIIFDRCLVQAGDNQQLRRAFGFNGEYLSVISSYISGIQTPGAEAQGIWGCNGGGPFRIWNTFLEGAGENILFGGADTITPNLTPSHLEVRGNYLFKRRVWQQGNHGVKNLFELKHARWVTVDGNILENVWTSAQTGFAVLFTTRNQDGGNPWATVSDVEFTNNIVRHAGGGLNIALKDTNYPSAQGRGIVVRNNLFEDLNWSDGAGRFLILGLSNDVTLDHNTVFNAGPYLVNAGYGVAPPMSGFSFTNNIVFHSQYGITNDQTGQNEDTGFNTYHPDGVLTANAIIGGQASQYPTHPGNLFPATQEAVGFVDLTSGNYALASNSPYKGLGTLGSDPGVDFGALQAATLNSIAGGNLTSSTPVITTSSLPAAVQGQAYSQQIQASGGTLPYVWDISAGSLPTGMTLSSSGLIFVPPTTTGTFNFTARLTDSASPAVVVTKALSILVNAPPPPVNQPPVVALTNPSAPVTVTQNQTIILAATASDDGSIAKVEFYDGTTKLGEDTTSPYSFPFSSATLGVHQIKARAIDNQGVSTDSAVINITVIASPPPTSAPVALTRLVATPGDNQVTLDWS